MGLRRVILPRGNQKDLRELPEEVRKEMQFVFADRVEDVLKDMLPQLKMTPRPVTVAASIEPQPRPSVHN